MSSCMCSAPPGEQCIDAWFDGANHGWCPLCKVNILEALRREAIDGSSPTATAVAPSAVAPSAAAAGQNGFRGLSSGVFAV